ncbi:MAG: phosphoribosyltransferase family protein, partial [Parcubacteria group bacterium]
MNNLVKKAIARPEVLVMGPIVLPSINLRAPISIASRKMYSYPETLRILGEEIGKIVRTLSIDKIAGCETSGIVLGTAVSMVTRIPMLYVRKEKKQPPRFAVEGVIHAGDKVALIDDSIVAAKNKLVFINHIEEVGGMVTDIIVACDARQRQKDADENMKVLADKHIRFHALFTWPEWYEALHEKGYMSQEMLDIAIDAAHDLPSWQGDQAKEK